MACRLTYDVDFIVLLDGCENRCVDEVLLAVFRLDNSIHFAVRILSLRYHVVYTLTSYRMEINHLRKLIFQCATICTFDTMIRPDTQLFFASIDFLEFLQILNGITGIADNRAPTIGDNIIIGDDRIRSRMIACRVYPPTRMENLMCDMSIQAAHDTGNTAHVVVNEARHTLHIADGTGNCQSTAFDEVLLDVNCQKQTLRRIIYRCREPFLLCHSKDGIHVCCRVLTNLSNIYNLFVISLHANTSCTKVD